MKKVWTVKGFHSVLFGIYTTERKAERARQMFMEEHPEEWFQIEEWDLDEVSAEAI